MIREIVHTCKTCNFFDPIKGRYSGRCRQAPPFVSHGSEYAVWPIVNGYTDWCGAHPDRREEEEDDDDYGYDVMDN